MGQQGAGVGALEEEGEMQQEPGAVREGRGDVGNRDRRQQGHGVGVQQGSRWGRQGPGWSRDRGEGWAAAEGTKDSCWEGSGMQVGTRRVRGEVAEDGRAAPGPTWLGAHGGSIRRPREAAAPGGSGTRTRGFGSARCGRCGAWS